MREQPSLPCRTRNDTISPVQAPIAVNQTFLDNMRQLWRHHPKLALRIDELPVEAAINVQPSKKGPMTASVETGDGRTLYLHSRYDPLREARDFCKTLEQRDAYTVILAGLGLGYHVKALIEMLGAETVIFVTEPDLPTVKTALEHTDLSQELATGRVEILTTLEKDALHDRLQRHSTVLMLGAAFVAPPVARDHNADFHNACRQAITDFIAFAKISIITLLKNAAITCRNIANNLPTYVSTPPADVLRGRFTGVPAILVAAGPSLAKNIDQVHALRGNAVLIAAQTTLRVLLNKGIEPHFVTSLDFSELSRQFFEGVDIPDDLVLVAEPKATWHVIDTFRGTPAMAGRRVVLLDNEFAHRCVGEDLAKRTPMEAGSTVMHLALYLAQWLGCDPIIFIGQDLGFSGHCYYAPGVPIHRAWQTELGRFGTLEMKEWERIVRSREILQKTKDLAGRDIYTDEQMFSYREQFERDFAKTTARVIDATEGGVRMAGTTVMTLQEAAAQFCREPIAHERFSYLKSSWYNLTRLEPARTVLASRLDELDAFRKLCIETRDVLQELETLLDKPDRFDRRIARVDELRTLVQQHELIFTMTRDVSQVGELQKFAADRRLASDAATGSTRAGRQLQRDREFIKSLLDGCDRLKRILEETATRFDDAIETSKVE